MTKTSKMSIGLALLFAISLSLPQAISAYDAAPLDLNRNCTMRVRSGWNLMSAAELSCGFLSANNFTNTETYFPAYLDLYAYDGNEYIYARVTKQELRKGGGRSLESGLEKYANNSVKKGTSNQVTNIEDFSRSLEKEIKRNNALNIKEYAGRIVKELVTSVWVYNPGRDFTIEYSSKYNDEVLAVSAMRLLATDMGSAEWSQVAAYLESKIWPDIERMLEREKGYEAFLKELSSGQIILDSGWNFLTYSRILSDDEGHLNFRAGNCSISKAYVFNNDTKKWVSAESATRSLIGAGMVVYNSGAPCTLTPTNGILNRLQSMFRDSSGGTPPPLPT